MDYLGVFYLFIIQIAFLVLAQRIGENQDRVERRPQFVAHGGEELGFVLGGHFQFADLVFQLVAQQLKLVILLRHLTLLFSKQTRLGFQLFVGNAQFFLLSLQTLFRRAQGLGL